MRFDLLESAALRLLVVGSEVVGDEQHQAHPHRMPPLKLRNMLFLEKVEKEYLDQSG